MRNAPIRTLEGLQTAGFLPALTPELKEVAAQFDIALTGDMADLISKSASVDPIAAQFIPSAHELAAHPDELADPTGDAAHSPVPGIVHRYPDRVLLKPLHTCAVYCRFCFRREQVGKNSESLNNSELDQAIAYINAHSEIWEVILSGGDPLQLSDRRLADIVGRLNKIAHVKVIRIHTRIPAVDPARITDALINALRGRAAVYVLLHCNHARELTEKARAACARLIDGGIPMLSQSVLLRGINDDRQTLVDLMRAFVEARIKPHYLHQLDRAPGTGHFYVSLARGQELVRSLRGHLSGLCQPTYMLEIPGGAGKVPVSPSFAEASGDDWQLTSHLGITTLYRERQDAL